METQIRELNLKRFLELERNVEYLLATAHKKEQNKERKEALRKSEDPQTLGELFACIKDLDRQTDNRIEAMNDRLSTITNELSTITNELSTKVDELRTELLGVINANKNALDSELAIIKDRIKSIAR